jgi:2-keto-4-pentenoate hydratase/2-oxohepta-3-ene-1,7-dioic acid hydratase in catechol pathway
MRLYTTSDGLARQEDDGTLAVLDLPHRDVGALLRHGELADAAGARVRNRLPGPDEVALRTPVLSPGRFVIVGLNYRSHVDEFAEGMGIEPSYDVGDPFIATIPGTAAIGPGEAIVRPAEAPDQVDYEGEVALVIGRPGRDVQPRDAWSLVAGLTVVNDVSARDVQTAALIAGEGVGRSKSFPTFKPLGPCMATADAFGPDLGLALSTTVNGEVRQDSTTDEMLHPIPDLLAYIASTVGLEPGDVICTGSPRGVGMWSGGLFLRPGDEVAVTVEGVGTLVNPVR